MGVTAGIFLASILLKEMRYLVYIRYLCWLRHRGITFLTNIECVGIAPGPLAGIKPAHSGAALQKALVAFSATAPD
jgi:hypothetical protein